MMQNGRNVVRAEFLKRNFRCHEVKAKTSTAEPIFDKNTFQKVTHTHAKGENSHICQYSRPVQ